jgi:3,4-dihydroxy-2-butanone 4-phosphate synthase
MAISAAVQITYADSAVKGSAEDVMRAMQSADVKSVTMTHNGKKTKITNRWRIRTVQKLIDRDDLVRVRKEDSLKGWIYSIKTRENSGKTAEMTVVSATRVRINGKVYRSKRLDLRKLAYCWEHGNYTPVLQSSRTAKIEVRHRKKVVSSTDKATIRTVQALFRNRKFRRVKDLKEKGWIYVIRAKDSSGRTISSVTLVDKNTVIMNGRTYSGYSVDLDKLDSIFGIDRFA